MAKRNDTNMLYLGLAVGLLFLILPKKAKETAQKVATAGDALTIQPASVIETFDDSMSFNDGN